MSFNQENPQKGLIITDDISINPVLDFNLYRDAVVNIVKKSYPKFTIGIYGDWGTGKSTLMDSIDKKLQHEQPDLVIARFDTWRYERENQFALIPLLKTIEFSIPQEKYRDLKETFKEVGVFGLSLSKDFLSGLVKDHVGKLAGDLFKKGLDNFSEKIIPELKKVTEIEKNTIYFEGQQKIENAIKNIRKINPSFRIVVFVDDLDRCSPKKTLEVLESIKIFLGMEGFVYILGLSHDIITKLIDLEYKESGVKGEQYIKKMIQIPITLPKWNNNDIVELVQDLLKREIIDEKYRAVINDNIELISIAIENNPREIKRFLNNFIVAYEIFSTIEGFKPEELIIIQAIQLRWSSFYNMIIREHEQFREEVGKYVKIGDDSTRIKTLESEELKEGEDYDLRIRRLLRTFQTNLELWEFLRKNFDTLAKIKDWNIYRRATEVSRELTEKEDLNQIALDLLISGNIEEFNARQNKEFKLLNLSWAYLVGAYLVGAYLVGAYLTKANLTKAVLAEANLTKAVLAEANLTKANLTKANLAEANLTKANLAEANLFRADLAGANLTKANLAGADLAGANLFRADLAGANLTKANLEGAILTQAILTQAILTGAILDYTIIIDTKYENLILDVNTQFNYAIIDDYQLVDYINANVKTKVVKIKNKHELKEKLIHEGMDNTYIDYCLRMSKLPES